MCGGRGKGCLLALAVGHEAIWEDDYASKTLWPGTHTRYVCIHMRINVIIFTYISCFSFSHKSPRPVSSYV